MPIRRTQFARRAALVSCVALAALSAAAFAKDLPPSPDAAQKLQAFLAAYVGKQAPVTLSPADPGFLVAFDLAALTAPLKTADFAYDPATLKYHVIEQDDGLWRVEQTDLPPIVAHMKDETSTLTISGLKNTLVVDPSIAWWRSLNGSADRITLQAKTPGVDETFDLGALQMTGERQGVGGRPRFGGNASELRRREGDDRRRRQTGQRRQADPYRHQRRQDRRRRHARRGEVARPARPVGFPRRPPEPSRTRRQRGGVQDPARRGARQSAEGRRVGQRRQDRGADAQGRRDDRLGEVRIRRRERRDRTRSKSGSRPTAWRCRRRSSRDRSAISRRPLSPSASAPAASTSLRPSPRRSPTSIWRATGRLSRPTTRPRSAPS